MNKRLAYIVSRFPKVSETFILYEIVELRKLGFEVDIFPLVREREDVQHPEVQDLLKNTHYHRIISAPVILSQFYWLIKRPRRYLSTLWKVVRGNAHSPKFLVRGIAAFLLACQFARQIQGAGVRHVHAHWATHPALAAYVIHRLTGLLYSFTAHAHDIYVEQAMLEEKISASEFVVTISDYNRRFLTGLYGEGIRDKIDIIHCGIDPEIFQPRQADQQSDVFTIICVASLEEKKGHVYLIEACRMLRDKGIAFRCILVGDGDLREELQAVINGYSLSEYVTLLGRQPRGRVSQLLAESDVMVLPSIITSTGKKEGIPVALMEALATEMPVIATDISGISELIENEVTGLLVPEKDAAALANAVERLLEAPQLGVQFGKNGREKVMQEFDLHQNTERLAQRFIQAISQSQGV